MGKNHRHKKLLKSEKAKVKLKAKKLPKDTNVTDTNFKIKKIVINKQLESNDPLDILTKRKLNLKDLLARSRHYNVSSRKDALAGIAELISNYSSEYLAKNLNELFDTVLKLTLDIERPIRRECFRVLNLILSKVPNIKILPYYELLSSYLCCTMTHINQNVQEDSLLFVDLLIMSVPDVLAKYFIKIIPNFLDLISKIQNYSKLDRKLTIKLNNKQTTIKWRVKVLNRLEQLLKVMINECNNKIQCEENNQKIFKYDFKNYNNCFGIYNSNYLQTNVLSCFNKKYNDTKNDEKLILQNCIDGMIPILFDTWLESKPNDNNFEFESTLKEESSEVLRSVLIVFNLVWQLMEVYFNDILANNNAVEKFLTQFEDNFSKYFVEKFPYTQITSSNSLNNKNVSNSFNQCSESNLYIVKLHLIFHPVLRNKKYTKYDSKIFDYLNNCILNISKIDQQSQSLLMVILKECFSKKFNNLQKYDLSKILTSLVNSFSKETLSEVIRNEIFELLCNILDNEKLSRCESYQIFLTSLPNILTSESKVSIPILKIVVRLCKQNNKQVTDNIRKNILKIISTLENMQLNMNMKEEEITPYELLTYILYYINK